ncbi:MAG: hypothetical protein J6T10_29325 [Methanobrevibacter sp.]|nr:hypothetical protein [Methanobrevibacter sp.]
MEIKGITVISPMWGERKTTDKMVFSVIHQYISKNNAFNIHLVLVDDYIEGRGSNNESPYDYYLSDEFKELYDTEHIKISLIKNKEHKYQGESREIGWEAGDYDYFILIDCDDMLSPNACDRYLNILEKAKEEQGKEFKPIACIYGLLYSFDTKGYENNIVGNSIWVQSRLFNRKFIKKYNIHFLKGKHSRQGEDYPFIRKLDYAINHTDEWQVLQIPYGQGEDCQCTAFWFPNENSLSRQDPHYGQHLAGWTMASSNSILDFFEAFNKKYKFEDEEDEFMKHEYLNMTIYSFYNLLDFLKEVASTDYKPLKEDWYELRNNVKKLRQRFKDKYYDEVVYSDIEDMLYQVRHFSDVRFTESWIGNFYDYMNNDVEILNYTYDEMIDYCKQLTFDQANHEIHAPYVDAWIKRHETK